MTGELGASVSGSLNHTAPTTNKKESPPHQKSYACDRIVTHLSTNRFAGLQVYAQDSGVKRYAIEFQNLTLRWKHSDGLTGFYKQIELLTWGDFFSK